LALPVLLQQAMQSYKSWPAFLGSLLGLTGIFALAHALLLPASAHAQDNRGAAPSQADATDGGAADTAPYAIATPQSVERVAAMLNKYPDRFLFGSDTVAPAGPEPYFAVFDMWTPIWRLLTPAASLKVRKDNYQRIFDEGRRRVRAREAANVR
jgi:hypothetical protein